MASDSEVETLDRLRAACELGYATNKLQRVPHLALLSDEFYHTTLKPLMAQWLLLWLRRNGLHDVSDEQGLRALAAGVVDPALQADLTDRQVKLLNLGHDTNANLGDRKSVV